MARRETRRGPQSKSTSTFYRRRHLDGEDACWLNSRCRRAARFRDQGFESALSREDSSREKTLGEPSPPTFDCLCRSRGGSRRAVADFLVPSIRVRPDRLVAQGPQISEILFH